MKSPAERGLVPVEPGHSLSIRIDGSRIQLPRILNLDTRADRAILSRAVFAAPATAVLLEENLEWYLRYFPDKHWRRLFNGGHIVVPGRTKHGQAYSLPFLLQLTKELRSLSGYQGFAGLLLGFRNPPQVPATIFEVTVAAWCRTRELTVGLEFSPEIRRADHLKHPDFRWKTELGDLLCECKQANDMEAEYHLAHTRLFATLESAHSRHQFDPALRLDVWMKLAGPHLDRLLCDLVATAVKHNDRGRVPWNVDDRLAAILRQRGELPPESPDTIFGFSQQSTDVERRVSPEHAPFSLTLDISRSRKAMATRLIREARTQLPMDRASAVFLGIGGISAAGEKVAELLVQRSHRTVPFVSIFSASEARVMNRNGQPFDGRLAAERRRGVLSQLTRAIRAPVRRAVAWVLGLT